MSFVARGVQQSVHIFVAELAVVQPALAGDEGMQVAVGSVRPDQPTWLPS
jgi:hypothetical protein